MSKKNRVWAASVAAALGLAAVAMPATPAVVYDANSGTANAGGAFAADSHFGQDVTLTGTGQVKVNSFTVFGVRWNASSTTSQDLFIDFYTGANESSTATDALATATYLGGVGFGLTYPGAVGSYNYSLNTSSSNILVPAGVPVFVEATFTDSTGANYSTILYARFSPGAPVTGSNPGFVWVDSNLDGAFAGSEETSTLASATATNIRMAIDASPVPEPASLGLVALGGVAVLARRRRTA